jgi:titin
VVPQLSDGTPLAGGYSFVIQNYDPALSYSFVESHGGTVVRTGSTATVSGLGAGVFSEAVVSASSAGHTTVSATASGTSFPNGTVPQVSAVARTVDGFTFTLELVTGDTYAVTSGAGTVTLVGSTVTVTGLAAGASTTVHITASAPGVLDAISDVAGTAMFAGVAPVLSAPTAASGGFYFTVTNYSPDFTYVLATSAGTATRNGNRVTVGGLAAGAIASVTVTATRGGYLDASASLSGEAQAAQPAGGSPAPTPVPAPRVPTVTPGTVPPAPTTGTGSGAGSVPTESVSLPTPPDIQAIAGSSPGTGVVVSDGSSIHSQVTHDGQHVTVAAGDHLGMSVAGTRAGKTVPVGTDGVLEVVAGDSLQVNTWGLQPDSVVTYWSTTNHTKLGTGRTDASGTVSAQMELPRSLRAGSHTIVATGLDASGAPVSMQLGIRVLQATTASAVTSDSSLQTTIPVVVAILLLAGWLFIAWRRRRDDEADTDLANEPLVRSDY